MKATTPCTTILSAVIVLLASQIPNHASGLDLPNDTGDLTPEGNVRLESISRGATAWTEWRAKAPQIIASHGGLFILPDDADIKQVWSDVMRALEAQVIVLNNSDSLRAHTNATDATRDAIIEFVAALDGKILEHGLGEPGLMTLPEKIDILRGLLGDVPVELTQASKDYFQTDQVRIKESVLEQAESVGLTCN